MKVEEENNVYLRSLFTISLIVAANLELSGAFFLRLQKLGAKIIEYYFHNKEVPNSAYARFGTKPKQKTLSSKVSVFVEIGLHVVLLWMLGWSKQILLRTKTTSTA